MPSRVPKYSELFNPVLSALHELGGSASIEELTEQVIQDMRLPQEVVELPHGTGGRSQLEYRLAWARTYLKNNGLVTNSDRGVWALTPAGAKVQQVDPEEVKRTVRQARQATPRKAAQPVPPGEEPDQGDGTDTDEAVGTWRDVLLAAMMSMDPAAFERLCQRLLRESGFIEVEVTGRSGDGGIDGHGIIRVAGMISFPVLFQAKRYRGNIGANVVRDFRGAMVGRADKGLLITTGGFTREARREATRDGAPPIDLINGELLVDKLKHLKLGVRTRMVEVVEVDTGWFAAM